MISPKDVEHYAELGRIRIGAEEKKRLAKDFESILAYVKKLDEADTEGVLPLNGGVSFYNNFREDEINLEYKKDESKETARVIREFPEVENGYLKVPPVFE